MKSKKVVVVIPVHLEDPTETEIISLNQCLKVLSAYPIYIVAPQSLNLESYKRISSELQIIYVEPTWLSSYQQYNRLKCNRYFYDLFHEYEYLLTYELDAFVFKDELQEWCNKGYDYIGAPWLEGWGEPKIPYNFYGVGNSGFSLRNVRSCLSLLNKISYLEKLEQYQFLNWKGLLPRFPAILYQLMKVHNTSSTFEANFVGHEDGFWSLYAQERLSDFTGTSSYKAVFSSLVKNSFKVAPVEEALKFSFEVKPDLLYKMNGNNLPFGCHAWAKHDFEFWKPFICQS
jgi:hypothetical protein